MAALACEGRIHVGEYPRGLQHHGHEVAGIDTGGVRGVADPWIAVRRIARNEVLYAAVLAVDLVIDAAVRVLHFEQPLEPPARLIEKVGNRVRALGNAEVDPAHGRAAQLVQEHHEGG